MNFRSIAVLAALSVPTPSAGDNGGIQSSSSFPPAGPLVDHPTVDEDSRAHSGYVARFDQTAGEVKKDSQRDESTPLLEASPIDKNERMLPQCSEDEGSLTIDLQTDNYGFETSWTVEVLEGGRWSPIESGPPQGYNYARNTRYFGAYCLSPGEYRFTIVDMFKDGMCCTYGSGHYAGYVGGIETFSSPDGESSWSKRRHRFVISKPASPPTKEPTKTSIDEPRLPFRPKTARCSAAQRKAKVEILTDRYGEDTSWMVKDLHAGTVVVESTKEYGSYEMDAIEICLDRGRKYDFIVNDSVGDGMCCGQGEGYYRLYLQEEGGSWDEIISGGSFKAKEVAHRINLREDEIQMSDRDTEWLNSHNSRRKEWHEGHNKTFVPLKWSNSLKADSLVWAQHLLSVCGKGLYHDPDTKFGENLAGNSGSGSWGALRSTEAVLTRFVENEVHKKYPKNGHLTQVLWRSTKYVGCAEASKPKEGGRGMCRVQACRYARTGNCNMNHYMTEEKDWWIEPVMMDDSPCGPECPPDGCH